MYAPSGAETSAAGSVALVALGPGASASKAVSQSEPCTGSPGRWWVVWRSQIDLPPPGAEALT